MDGFIDLDTGDVVFYNITKDRHEFVPIDGKQAILGKIGDIVSGEINSQVIEFEMNRFYDGVDLITKKIYILYKTKGGIFKEAAINEAYNDDKIRFSWLLNEDATLYSGKIQALIQIEGKDEKNNPYVLKSMIFDIPIIEALCEFDADGVYHSWSTNIEYRIKDLEEYATNSFSFFYGTQNEYNIENDNGNIPNGMFITITNA